MKNEFPALNRFHALNPDEMQQIRGGGGFGWGALIDLGIDIYENWDEYKAALVKGFRQGRQAYGYK